MVARIGPKLIVDQMQMSPHHGDGVGTDALEFRMLLQHEKHLQQRGRIAMEYIVVIHFEKAVAHREVVRYGFRFGIRVQKNGFLKKLQQHLIDAADIHHGAVVALHELFDRQRVGRVLVAEHFGNARLMVEQQPVLAAAGEGVQGETDAPEQLAPLPQNAQLCLGQKALVDQTGEVRRAEMPPQHPDDNLYVPQSARTALDVGFEVIRGVIVTVMPLLLLLQLGLEKCPRRPHFRRRNGSNHLLEEFFGPAEQPGFHERCGNRQVVTADLAALGYGSGAVADLKAQIPQERQETRDGVTGAARAALRQQQQVDIGAGMQLAAAVAADRHNGHGRFAAAAKRLPGAHNNQIYQPGAILHQLLNRLVAQELLFEAFAGGGQHAAPGRQIGDGMFAEPGLERVPVEMLAVGRGDSSRIRGAAARRIGRDGAHARSAAPSVSTS